MKSWRKIVLTTCLAMGLTGMYTAQADNLDTYRNLLIKKTYTIKYENVTPQARQTNKDKVTLTGKNTMNTEDCLERIGEITGLKKSSVN